MITGKTILKIAGSLSLAISALHIVLIFIGAPAYLYFGAGEAMARMDVAGSWLPAFVTFGVAMVAGIFSAYAFACSGVFHPLPKQQLVIKIIAAIYTLRGLGVFGELFIFLRGEEYPARFLFFSLVSLGIGLLHIAGIIRLKNEVI